MPQGGVTVTEVAGGGPQLANGAAQARQIAILGCSPGGTVNTIYQPGNQAAAQSLLGAGALLDEAALILAVTGAPPPLLVPVAQSSVGAVSGSSGLMVANLANVGTGTLNVTIGPHLPIKVLCTTGGALGTAKFQFSKDGGTTYGAIQTSVNADSSSPWVYEVPGTFCLLSFAYGSPTSYTSTKTLTVAVDGTVTNGTAWTGAVTQASSPIDQYELLVTVKKTGALGVALFDVSLDGGVTSAGVFFVPASGVFAVTDGHGGGTGLVITASSATYTVNDSYIGYALPPAPSSSAITNAITAMIASPSRPTVCALHVQAMPSSAANAITLAQAVDTALATAFASGLDWQAFIECPTLNDIVMPSSVPLLDTADTDTVVQTARVGITCNRVALQCSSGGIISPITSMKVRRPFGWALLQRYARNDPKQSLARPADGPLNFSIGTLGRDEKLTSIQLGDVQFNVPTTYDGYPGAYENITSGGFATKNLTLSALYQDAETLRILNVVSAAVRVVGISVLADRPPVNSDNTIAESAARDYDTLFDTTVKKAAGILIGGAFGAVAQVSSVSAVILRSSVLGASPRRLDVAVSFKGLGMISAVNVVISVQGA